MNKQNFYELAQMYLFEELNEEEKINFENFLMEDDEANSEFESLKTFYSTLLENKPKTPSDLILENSRQNLLRTLKNEDLKESIPEKIVKFFHDLLFVNYKVAMGGVATLALGIFIGYFFFSQSEIQTQLLQNGNSINIDKLEEGGVDISNIKFPNPFSKSGEIEFRLDTAQPISYNGNPNDQITQRLLAMALLTSNNPGIRLKTINTLSTQAKENFIPDPKVKKALITSLMIDDNAAVRKEALNFLKKFPFSEDVRDAFLFVLSNDPNTGLRVAAINALSDLKIEGLSIDNEIKNELNKRVETDENEFIKLRAASLLQEVK